MGATQSPSREDEAPFFVLALDGGGSKGVYTVGVLKELEAYWGEPLYSRFDLVFGTSTGAIIAALLALGKSAVEIERIYLDLIPRVMSHKWAKRRSKALAAEAKALFGDKGFDAFKTRVAIVATDFDRQRPMIFKSDVSQSYTMRSSWAPGFGVTVAEALIASSAAYPFFKPVRIRTTNQGEPIMLDGGYCANNPTLLAIADATKAHGVSLARLRVLSLGVGHYKEPNPTPWHRFLFRFRAVQVFRRMFEISTTTIERLREILFPTVICVRIDDSYPDAHYATDLLEANPEKLRKLVTLGRESYSRYESEIMKHFPARIAEDH